MTATYITVAKGEELLLEFGDGGAPENYAVKFAINAERAIQASATAVTSLVPRTDDPSKPHKTTRQIAATDSKLDGAGTANAGDEIYFWAWLQSGAAKDMKWGTPNRTGANGGYTGSAPYVLTAFDVTGRPHDLIQFKATFEQADQPTVVANA